MDRGAAMTNAKPNRLIHEKSPYLLQHAHNPVEWYPWGEEAFIRAKKEDKPIFLSIGYSTCHWCHVMAHESFEDPGIAELLNKYFVNIKLDREERPDVDALYMTAVQALTGAGGWPMSVWLTPDLKPFYGGTYFPPTDRYGRPGFDSVIVQLAEVYQKDRQKILEASEEITATLRQYLGTKGASAADRPQSQELMRKTFQMIAASYDKTHGGFSPAPKFPMPVYMEFLLDYHQETGDPSVLEMVKNTIARIGKGGITDQLGGGFARYSTDEQWVVPHFEKMLYDNAQLISISAAVYERTRDPFFERLTRRAIDYVLKDLTHPDGGFFSAEDADSEGKEGTFYLWTLSEIKALLGPDLTELFSYRYAVTTEGNFLDPHTRESGMNVLVQAHEIDDVARHFGRDPMEVRKTLDKAEKVLLEARHRRPRPHRDDKILTEWNGLMISALSKAGTGLENDDYLAAAEKAARFIKTQLYDESAKQLYRSWRDGGKHVLAQQADYAYFIAGLLDLFEATGEAAWLAWAVELQEAQDALFFDHESGGYYMNIARPDLLFRMKDESDNVIPSGNSAAALNGFKLGRLTNRKDFIDRAAKTLRYFAKRLDSSPLLLAKMVLALDYEQNGFSHVVVIGPRNRPDTRALTRAAQLNKPRNTFLLVADPETSQVKLAKICAFVKPLMMIDGRATAYVCVRQTCERPTTQLDELNEQLKRGEQ